MGIVLGFNSITPFFVIGPSGLSMVIRGRNNKKITIAMPIFNDAASQIVEWIPKNRINRNALDNAPNTAPKVLNEYKLPTSRPTRAVSCETYLLKIGSVAPMNEVGTSKIIPQIKNLYKLA